MRRTGLVAFALMLAACEPPVPQPTAYPTGNYGSYYTHPSTQSSGTDGGGKTLVAPRDPGEIGKLDSAYADLEFDGGRIEFELRREGTHVYQVARNRYAVPVMIAWSMSQLENVAPAGRTAGVALLPAANQALGRGPAVLLTELDMVDATEPYRRNLTITARFGDPRVEPRPYAYAMPYRKGMAFQVLQGFHGAFSHRGSNEFAIDFDCPVATPVIAAREGTVVATNARAQGSGVTRDFLEYKRVNFVLVLHDDGTLGEYMHLAPSGIQVRAGQHVDRGTELGLSGNTGFSSTPHLHFQVMTAAEDGVAARSFPFELADGPQHVVVPVQGHTYLAWE